MTCDEVQPKITPFLFRELKVDQTHQVQSHIKDCGACRQEAERLKRAIQYLRLDPGLPASEERISTVLAGMRGRFSVRATQRVLATSQTSAVEAGGFRVSWSGIAAFLVPLLALAGLALLADVGGLRTRLLARGEDDGGAENPERPTDDAPANGGNGGGGAEPVTNGGNPGDSTPSDDELARALDGILERAGRKIQDAWRDSKALPEPERLLDPADRVFLDRWASRLRPRLFPEATAPADRRAAALLLASAAFVRPEAEEPARVALALSAGGSPPYLALAAIRAARVWRLQEAFDPMVALLGAKASREVKVAAAGALAACYGGGDLANLSGLFSDAEEVPEEIKEAILSGLAAMRGDSVVELARRLFDRAEDPELQVAAAGLLAKIEKDSFADHVLSQLGVIQDARTRARVLAIAGEVGGEREFDYLVHEVLLFGGQPEEVLRAAVESAAKIASGTDRVQALEQVYASPALPAPVRAVAASHLDAGTKRQIGAALVQQLKAGSDDERARAAELLAWLSAQGRAEALVAALADASPDVRRAAALALAQDGPRPREVLQALAADAAQPSGVRAAAARALMADGVALGSLSLDPAVVEAVVGGILDVPLPNEIWLRFQLPGQGQDPYGRVTLKFQPAALVDHLRKSIHLPIDIDPEASAVLQRTATVRAAPPFASLGQFLAEVLPPAGLYLRREPDRIVVTARER
ncbi:MAG: HEAT repeat domain-containing protein [Planctomycetes bacterium]|nr:HEAT repeat domain-containing protein [Planctomycetota bacterium]